MIVLKEVGSDALFALLKSLRGVERERAVAFYEHCRDNDVALAVAQTDVKGNRVLPPYAQDDPDLYLHVVAEDAHSITVRGAKVHTSYSANADELIVLATRAMTAAPSAPGDSEGGHGRAEDRARAGMRTPAAARCMHVNAILVAVVVSAPSGPVRETARTAVARTVQVRRERRGHDPFGQGQDRPPRNAGEHGHDGDRDRFDVPGNCAGARSHVEPGHLAGDCPHRRRGGGRGGDGRGPGPPGPDRPGRRAGNLSCGHGHERDCLGRERTISRRALSRRTARSGWG
jgi:hypothetical protein